MGGHTLLKSRISYHRALFFLLLQARGARQMSSRVSGARGWMFRPGLISTIIDITVWEEVEENVSFKMRWS